MSGFTIISDWKRQKFSPVYWLEGEEEFYIDEVVNYAEKHILSEADASFNLSVFYGKDASWPDVINACRRYPMFAERQVVVLKEAQQMRDIDKLEAYVENPLSSTILVVSYKGKTLDGRGKLSKLLKKKGYLFLSKKIWDSQLPAWANGYLQSKGYTASSKALMLLVDHVGNDLNRIANEVEKLSMNLGDAKQISEDDIEKYIGVSKDYNITEFQDALTKKDLAKAVKIIQYFDANPKAAPLPWLLPSLYNFFSKMLLVYQMPDKSEKSLRPHFFNNPVLVKQATETLMSYTFEDVEKIILLLHHYNLKSIGINSRNEEAGSLLKELSFKIVMAGNWN